MLFVVIYPLFWIFRIEKIQLDPSQFIVNWLRPFARRTRFIFFHQKDIFSWKKNDLLGSIRVHYSFFRGRRMQACISREYISDKNVKLITTKKYIWRTNRACKKEWLIIQAAEKSNIIHSKMCIYTTYFYNLKDFHLWNIEIIIIKSNFFFQFTKRIWRMQQ